MYLNDIEVKYLENPAMKMIHKGVRVGFDGISGLECKAETSLIRLDMSSPQPSVGKEEASMQAVYM